MSFHNFAAKELDCAQNVKDNNETIRVSLDLCFPCLVTRELSCCGFISDGSFAFLFSCFSVFLKVAGCCACFSQLLVIFLY